VSFAITLYGQCCRLHVVGQQVFSDISVIRSCWSIGSLSFEYNNINLLPRPLIAVLGTSILFQISNTVCPTIWRRVGLLDNHEYGI